MKRVLILGATSAIARAIARIFAGRGDRLFLVARDATKLEATARDLRVHGAAGVDFAVADLGEVTRHETLLVVRRGGGGAGGARGRADRLRDSARAKRARGFV